MKREEIERYADDEKGGKAVKKVKKLENKIEDCAGRPTGFYF